MQLSLLSVLTASLCTLASSAPVASSIPKNFFLVTTTQSTCNQNSSLLANVSATSLFDAYEQNPYVLRLIGPGYDSLPQFNLTHGSVGSFIYGPELQGPLDYRSAPLTSGGNLDFYPKREQGGLTLIDGYLLAFNGSSEGWKICDNNPTGESIIAWNSTAKRCNSTYIQAVANAPY